VYKLGDVIPDRQGQFLFSTLCPKTPLGLVLGPGWENARCVHAMTHPHLIVIFLSPVFIIFHDVTAFISIGHKGCISVQPQQKLKKQKNKFLSFHLLC
jgi:hypothetical protein